MTVASSARMWQDAGFSTIPILPNASKRPAVRWTEFMGRVPSLGEVEEWWGNGREYGLALIMGKVSGNMEMLELEARATNADSLLAIENAVDEAGVGHVWDRLQSPEGYCEMSPTGGLHFIYRISDHDVPGNEKIARRPATSEELEENPADKIKVLVETRGEGGYVIVAPTSGLCHPNGEAWIAIRGHEGVVVTLTWEERCRLHEAIGNGLDVRLSPANLPVQVTVNHGLEHRVNDLLDRPGDAFEAQTDWSDALLLGGAGWQAGRTISGTTYWTRPGKSVSEGPSATTGRDAGRDRLYVFSTSTVFPTDEPLTKFHAYSILHHGGDHAAAASQLRRMGFGSPGTSIAVLPDFEPNGNIEQESSKSFTLDDVGAAERLADYVDGDFTWVTEENRYYRWDGRVWEPDNEHLAKAWSELTRKLVNSPVEAESKWASKARSSRTTNFALKHMKTVGHISRSRREFDRDRGLLNLTNGVLDLRTQKLHPHHRDRMMTRMARPTFRPEATCPSFLAFMEAVIPDPAVRAYVQRAVGYSLLGDADQRALFLVWGPSGTGKSQFMETMQYVFGDYGSTASVGAFLAKRDGTHSSDVHRLRGKRFVSTSETADNARFDEEVVKRLTGRDTMTTRSLYQTEQEWVPECAIWIATNHKPRFTSDDDAIWRRSKLLPFQTRFGSEGGPEEIPDYARRFLFAEADGILNWMLEGVRDFLANGLQEPEEIKEQAALHRQEVDTVAMFLEDSISDGRVAVETEGKIRTFELYNLYSDWCRQSGERVYGRRRFINRVQGYVPGSEWVKVGGHAHLTGLARSRNDLFQVWGVRSLTANDT